MCLLSDTTGSFSSSDALWETSVPTEFIKRKEFKELLAKANSVNLSTICKFYNIKIDIHNRKVICPFPHHKNGHESSASFFYYPNTNTYWCFGCKTGSTPVDFVSAMENISSFKAANKILNLFEKDIDLDVVSTNDNFSEKLLILTLFSDWMREHNHDPNFIKIGQTFDALYNKHNLSNEAIKFVITSLIGENIFNN